MQKAHQNINWENKPSTETPINETNLNLMDRSIDTIDDRVVTFDTTKANQSDLLQGVRNVTFTASTGTFHITYFNGTVIDIDTDIEKIVVNFSYDSNPSSPHYQCLVLTLDDGTVEYIDLSALITQYEFVNTPRIAFTVDNNGKISADIVGGSVTDDKLQPQYLADITAQAQAGAQSAINASEYKLDAEAWANGTRNGQAVPTTDPAYHNNSRYWSQQANVTSFRSLTDVDIDDETLADGQYMGYDSNTGMITNMTIPQQDAGVPIRLIVISEEGSTVTITKPNGDTVTPRHISTGHWQADFSGADAYGTYVIDAVLGGDDAQVSLTVDDCKTYIIDDSHFHADITVTYPSGATVSCSKTGEQTMYATSSPYTFTVHSTGVWTITGTRNGITETQTVTITTNGQTESITLTIVPDGETITPTDDVQILLNCADIWDKAYTTISELIADDTSLLTVLTSDNAIDYLVRSTTFASAITADSDAMAMIGAYDYASDTLLADSTWCTAIIGSAYNTSVANVTTPKMTSDTTPSGEVFYSSQYNNSTYAGWHAFDDDDSSIWTSTGADNSPKIGYIFPSEKRIYACSYYLYSDSATNIIVQKSADNTSWVDASETQSISAHGKKQFITTDHTASRYWRISANHASGARSIQFYGRENGGVQTWLRAGGITDKSYTTLAEVLADTTTLSALIASHDAVDYLVTAKAFIDGICADSNAMSYIGLNNYCANTLLADAGWCTGICNSTYFESVLNAKVPTMTDNTHPSGVASSSTSSYTANIPYLAFDGNDSTPWADNTANHFVQYQFTQSVNIKCVKYKEYNTSVGGQTFNFKVSSDGSTFTQLESNASVGQGNWKTIILSNNTTNYQYYRIEIPQSAVYGVYTLQFYGREDV